MSYTIHVPAVAHIVADLDDLEIPAPARSRIWSAPRRLASLFRRVVTHRSFAYPLAAVPLAFVVACSDSDDAVTAPRPVASVRLTPTTVVIEVGATRQLDAIALDASGNALPGRPIQWSTDTPGVATVSATGLVQTVARGYAVITATAEGKSASTAFTVVEPEPAAELDLVFERRAFNGAGEIWRLSPTTGATTTMPLVVTVPGAVVRDAAPSPDGTRIAFTVAWYPDGSPLMDGDVYIANIDGTDVRQLTTADGMDDQPAWSPDGTRIAFRSRRSGHDDIWIMGSNGSGQTNLTNDALPATSTERNPVWSPDGTRIAYSSDLDTFAYGKLWTMRADGHDKQRVLPATVGTAVIDMEPSWSPDGTLIAFASTHQNAFADIFTMKPDGTEITRRTNGGSEYWSPRWLLAASAAGRVASR